MKVQISFKVINPDFDQEYADQYKEGQESDSNCKYISAKSFEVHNAKSVELIEDGIYQLQGQLADDSPINLPIPNVTIFRCHLEDGDNIEFATSKSVLSKTHQARNEKYTTTRCYFYINSQPNGIQLVDELFINEKQIPEVLFVRK